MTKQSAKEEREQLEQAIAALEAQRAHLGDAVVEAGLAPMRQRLGELAAADEPGQQRKQVTLLYMDIVGSTDIVYDLDPEDNLAIMDTAMLRLAVPVEEHGGQVTRYMGDGFLAIFGLQASRESDPEMAVRAGLTILERAQEYAREIEEKWGVTGFSVRLGVSTGPVVIGGGTEGAETLAGLAVNLSARLEAAAEAGTLLISHHTYQHIRGVFDFRPLAPIEARGFPEPVPVYQVLQTKPRAFRTRRRGVEGIETRMIGRAAELALLQDAYRTVVNEKSRLMVTVTGDAGLGKSRLLYEYENWIDLQPEDVLLFRGRARLETQHIAYGLLRDLFAFRFAIQDDDPGQIAQQKVVRGLEEAMGPDPMVDAKAHTIGQLLGYDFPGSDHEIAARDGAARRQARRLYDQATGYLTDYFRAAAGRDVVLVLLEDLHWADNSSLEVVARLAFALHDRPALFVAAARPLLYERREDWMDGQPFHRRLDLKPLSRSNSGRLTEEVLQKVAEIPDVLTTFVVGRAEGNPFFVEELIKMLVMDGAIIVGDEQWEVVAEKLVEARIPPTLTGLLQARLERLPHDQRTILQQASVVGRNFWDDAVVYLNRAGVGPLSPGSISASLTALQEKELIFPRGASAFAGTQEYSFKHALLRDVSYGSLLRRHRRAYHALAAAWLREHSGVRAGELTGIIADHLVRAGENVQAVQYLKLAGEEALSHYAQEEAIEAFSRALELLGEDDLPTRFDLLHSREHAYDRQGRRQVQQADLEQLRLLAESLDDNRKRADVALLWSRYHVLISEHETALREAEQALTLARELNDSSLKAHSLINLGRIRWRKGAFTEARDQLEQALAIARAAGDRQMESLALLNLGNAVTDLGDHISGREHYERALEISDAIGDKDQEHIINNLGISAARAGDLSLARDYFERALALARETGSRQARGLALGNLGHVSADMGDYAASREFFEQALENATLIDNRQSAGYALTGLGEALTALDQLEEAAVNYRKAIDLRELLGQRHLAMESRAGLARSLLAQGEVARSLSQVEEILSFMHSDSAAVGGESLLFYATCAQVLLAAGDPRGGELLEKAHSLLQEAAREIADEDARRKFLENVPWNREIVGLWASRSP